MLADPEVGAEQEADKKSVLHKMKDEEELYIVSRNHIVSENLLINRENLLRLIL